MGGKNQVIALVTGLVDPPTTDIKVERGKKGGIAQILTQQQTLKRERYGPSLDVDRFWTIIRWLFQELGVTTPKWKFIYQLNESKILLASRF